MQEVKRELSVENGEKGDTCLSGSVSEEDLCRGAWGPVGAYWK